MTPFGEAELPAGIRARFIDNSNGLTMHVLEAGENDPRRPCLLLLHGFPEIAFSWRKLMVPLAEAGFYIVAPDQRGYGRTIGGDVTYEGDLSQYRVLNMVRDTMGLLAALGRKSVAAVIGHDYGASVTAWCTLVRPDVFQRMVLMSAPFPGPPTLPLGEAKAAGDEIHAALAALTRPRKHYHWYYSTRPANDDMWHAPQGVHDFLRAYYHHKSGDWTENRPFKLKGWTAEELAKIPTYYVMDRDRTMAETVAREMPSPDHIAANRWLTEAELGIYSREYRRTGFQGGLQHYRIRTGGAFNGEQQVFSGRTIDVPSLFIAGASDWGIYQSPGAIERMEHEICTDMRGVKLIEGAGHWVQQEKPEQTLAHLQTFLGPAAALAPSG